MSRLRGEGRQKYPECRRKSGESSQKGVQGIESNRGGLGCKRKIKIVHINMGQPGGGQTVPFLCQTGQEELEEAIKKRKTKKGNNSWQTRPLGGEKGAVKEGKGGLGKKVPPTTSEQGGFEIQLELHADKGKEERPRAGAGDRTKKQGVYEKKNENRTI